MNHVLSRGIMTLISCGFYLLLFPSLTHAQSATQSTSCQPLPPPNARFGINVARDGGKEITNYDVAQLQAGWYLDYTWHIDPPHPNGMDYMPMIRWWREDADWQAELATAIEANPGSIWILGNEPDNRKQDNRTPDDYAIFYHTAYTFIKEHDPSSRVAMAAITQPTPLRLRYLDMVLSAYIERYGQRLPVDLWTVHVYMLPEDYIWGVGIPPGLDDFAQEGMRYSVDDHDDITIFAQQVRTFRTWMTNRGYRDRPLILSEFGILLPPDLGYGGRAIRRFMLDSFDFLQTATDPVYGYQADNNRLVQQWAWFSLNYYAYDATTGVGHNGHLLDYASGAITPAGRLFAGYLKDLTAKNIDLTITESKMTPHQLDDQDSSAFTIQFTVANQGTAPIEAFTVELWLGESIQLGVQKIQQAIAPSCQGEVTLVVSYSLLSLPVSKEPYAIRVVIAENNSQLEQNHTNNIARYLVRNHE